MTVGLRRDPRIGMAEDALHRSGVRTGLEEQASGGVSQVVKSDRPHLRLDPKLHLVFRTTSRRGFGGEFRVTAAFATADVFVPEHDSGPAERTVKDLLEFHILAHHLAVRFGKDELRGRRIDCPAQKRNELVGDRDALFVRALRLAPGTHTVELAYEKDESVDDGLDDAAILNFELSAGGEISRLTVSTVPRWARHLRGGNHPLSTGDHSRTGSSGRQCRRESTQFL